MTSFVNLHC